jgi:Fe-S-cluster-containing dehydrogenase component
MSTKSFVVDVGKCSGCSLCIVACKDEHVDNSYARWTAPQPATGHFWIDVIKVERGDTPRVAMSYLPLLCQHCGNAPCMKVCPEHAIKRRDDGLVWIDPELCNGCGLCQPACPYNVIFMNGDRNIAQKCTGCAHRVDQGLLPRCADVCPHEAIMFVDSGGVSDEALDVYHPEYQTKPRVLWKGLPKPWIAGLVVDKVADEVISGATITAMDLFDDRTVTAQSDAFGDFWIKNLDENRKYSVEIMKAGYAPYSIVTTTEGDRDLGTIYLSRGA